MMIAGSFQYLPAHVDIVTQLPAALIEILDLLCSGSLVVLVGYAPA